MTNSNETIPAAEQRWLSESFVDPNGRVFEWRGELYRALEPEFAARWKQLSERGVIASLVRDGPLIESELTRFTTEAGNAVLHHRRVAVQSYCYEWPPAMLQDAALRTLDLWALELQAPYSDIYEPFVDILADTALILWTLSLRAELVAAVIASSALLLSRDALHNANEFTQSKRLFFLPNVSLRSTRAVATATNVIKFVSDSLRSRSLSFYQSGGVSSSFPERKLFLCER